MKTFSIVAALAAVQAASAHTIFQQLNGNSIGYAIRKPDYNGPITDVTSNDIACNGGPNPTKSSPYKITVAAGSTAKLTWRHTENDVVDASHKGPVMAYMKKVSNALTDPGYGSGWFKIYEDGFSNGKWGVDRLIAANGVQTITIPSCIPPGDYLLRGELVALHSAGSYPGAQFYMECAQITVTGGGSANPSTVSLPGAYKGSDPGITINIYYPTVTSYTAPGPAVFKC